MPLKMLDGVDREIDVERGPMKVLPMRPLDAQDGVDGRIPRELVKGKSSPRSSSRIQNPCGEMLVTSAVEVVVPGGADLRRVILDRFLDLDEVPDG